MHRREWLCVGICLLIGCGSVPGHVKGDPPVAKAPRLASKDSDIQQASGEKDENTYRVKFETTAGDFVVEVHNDWAPLGAKRFRELVEAGFYDNCKFFRVIPDFMVQFGISGDPKVMDKWRDAKIKDDPVRYSNKKGYITFATSGPDSRTTQVFINYKVNNRLDDQGFAPFGKVIEGLDIVEKLYSGYGGEPSDQQPRIQREGNKFLESKYPNLDTIKKCTIVE
jgi:peptidyl-prolyl cis-trans isomerase A (cyclophilin A)